MTSVKDPPAAYSKTCLLRACSAQTAWSTVLFLSLMDLQTDKIYCFCALEHGCRHQRCLRMNCHPWSFLMHLGRTPLNNHRYWCRRQCQCQGQGRLESIGWVTGAGNDGTGGELIGMWLIPMDWCCLALIAIVITQACDCGPNDLQRERGWFACCSSTEVLLKVLLQSGQRTAGRCWAFSIGPNKKFEMPLPFQWVLWRH